MALHKGNRTDATSRSPPDREAGAGSISLEKDLAIKLVGEHAHEVDPELEKKVLLKIDLFLIPAMIVGYGLVYYDKAILGAAVLFGMTKDLSLSVVNTSTAPPITDTSRLSWGTSLFYFGMLAGLYPMTFVLQRFNLGRILGGVVILWALICMLTAAVTSWKALYAQRFFLGFVESVIPTGFMCIVSGFYTQEEQALRQSWWFSSTGLFTIIGGALNYGFAQITGGALKRWQYIYLLAGCLTFLFGIFCFFIPNSPVDAWFLTTEERVVAVERLRKGQTGVRCQKIKIAQLREALLDVKLWLVFIMMGSAYTVNGAVSGFGPLIVSTFGWSTLESILWQFPLGGLCFLAILASNCFPVIAGLAGYSIIGTFGAVVSLTIVIGMSNVAGASKKSCMAGSIFVAYCVGNIVGPQLIKSETKNNHYPELWTGLIICYCITIAASVALYAVLWRENNRRESHSGNDEERDRLAFLDLTDKENPYFRYVL
ncbi:hypothetical protein SLS60_007737 [Paraconiothyrium brasiliense]|uniref:MFS transporter n=1 Tax=Paraconiothyrium brasiliense TaxID=300254 RepID=A0ABR3R2I6_9PLEO